MGVALFVVADIPWVSVGLKQVLPGINEESTRPGRWVADAFSGLRIAHLHHHPNDVAGRAELAVCPGGVESAKKILVKVSLHVLVLRRDLHGIDRLACLN